MVKRRRNIKREDTVDKSVEKLEDKLTKRPKTRLKNWEIAKDEKNTAINSKDVRDGDSSSFWLMKAEPETRLVNGHDVKFSIDDLKEMNVSCWDGVRNYQARNNMKAMKKGDLVFFYHSNCKMPGIVGIMKVCKEAYPDYTAFDNEHPYYDAKSDKKNPKWFMVDVEYVKHLPQLVSLEELKRYKDGELNEFSLLRQGRLSVARVQEREWEFINKLAEQPLKAD